MTRRVIVVGTTTLPVELWAAIGDANADPDVTAIDIELPNDGGRIEIENRYVYSSAYMLERPMIEPRQKRQPDYLRHDPSKRWGRR